MAKLYIKARDVSGTFEQTQHLYYVYENDAGELYSISGFPQNDSMLTGDLEIRHIAYQPEVQGSKNADYDPHHLDLELGHSSKLLFTSTDVELEPALNHRQAA